ncbi:MAG: InlB B-repeat-containing protein [Acholeplasmataceae bacterium]|nr:InlB B-repeat-containing protein [Acholeplasmataceae bacterium]
MKNRIYTFFIVLVFALLLFSCEKAPQAITLEILEQASEQIDLISETDEHLELPLTLTFEGYDITITWQSSNLTYLSNSGQISRPDFISGDQDVILTATLTYKELSYSKPYNLRILALPAVIVTYTVSFETNGGNVMANISVNEGQLIVEPINPIKEDYAFAGWYKDALFTIPWIFNVDTVDDDILLYAKWVFIDFGETYTVTFDSNGGTAVSSMGTDYGIKYIDEPEAPTKTGFVFAGWYSDILLTIAWNFEIDEVTSNMTLYAKWLPIEVTSYTVTFESNGGTEVSFQQLGQGEFISEPVEPTKDGYYFAGWFRDELLTSAWDFLMDTIDADMTLYASWSESYVDPLAIPISTPLELLAFITSGDSNTSYYLTQDIDMAGITLSGSSLYYAGTFDGQNYTIRNAEITSSGNKMGFLFKELLNGSVVKNIRFADSIHHGGGTSESCAFISAFAQGGATIENIIFSNVSVIHAGSYAGLLFGDVISEDTGVPVTIRNITVINDIDHWVEGLSYVGGLIGSARKPITINIEQVYFSSKVLSTNQAAGSIMGRFNSTGITLNASQVVIKGSVSSPKNVGMLLGTGLGGSFLNVDQVFVSDMTATSGTATVKILEGNNTTTTITSTNVFYNLETTSFFIGESSTPVTGGTGLLTSEITEIWFNSSGFSSTFFKYLEGSITKHSADTGPLVEIGFSVLSSLVKKYYIVGETLDLAELKVQSNFSDGSTVLLDDTAYTVDATDFNSDVIGIYTIVITYKTESKSFEVEVVDVMHIVVEDLNIIDTYALGSPLSLSGLVVKAILNDGSYLRLSPEDYTVDSSSYQSELAGTYGITVTYKTYAPVTFNVYVTSTTLVADNNVVTISVDQSYLGINGDLVSGIPTFTTIKSALQYLINQNLTSTIEKHMMIKSGTYTEKISVTIPHLVMIGEHQDTTIITYDAASGLERPEGGTWGTQGSATVAIKSSAINFMAKNVTFMNHFDYNGSSIADKQGVALVNEADQVIFYQVNFRGYQDTLYAKNGRQYFYDVYIEGIVDFIFGNAGPAFFEQSEIKSLSRSTGCISTNKGYPVSSSALVTYGYVFYQNEFTFEEGVPTGSVDLGRPWDQTAAIAYIENIFGDHISVRGWTEMSGNLPQNARFFEYNNEDVLGTLRTVSSVATELTSISAATYANKDNVFSQVNGAIDFGSVWDYQADLIKLQSIIFN